MAGNIRVKNYLDRDFEVLDRPKSLSLFVDYSLSDPLTDPQYSASIDGVSISSLVPYIRIKDTSTKNLFDSFAAFIPKEFVRVGTLSLVARGNSITDSVEDSCDVTIFPSADTLVSVTSQGTLDSSITTAFADGKEHVRLVLAAGSYTFPTDDLRDVDTLYTIEAAPGAQVFITNAIVNIKWVQFKNIRFSTNDRAAAKIQGALSTAAFYNCKFTGDGAYNVGRVGIEAEFSSRVKVVDSHFDSLWEGTKEVDSVRSCSWTDIGKSVFVDCARIIEGTVGYRNAYDTGNLNDGAWLQYNVDSAPVVKDNIVIESYNTAIKSSSSMVNAVIKGNVIHTFNQKGIELDTVENSYVTNNSIKTDLTSFCSQQTRYINNYVVNNYLSTICTNPTQMVVGSVWESNATVSTTNVGSEKILTVSSPRFSNNILLLKENSPLLFKGKTLADRKSFGLLPYQDQIGAFSYHPDTTLSSVLSSFTKNPKFGFSLTDSALPNQFV